DELRKLEVEALVTYLRSWKPQNDVFMGPSPEGLGRLLTSVVKETPARFADAAAMFVGLDPTYVRALMQGLREGLPTAETISWDAVLGLAAWVVLLPRGTATGAAERVDFERDPDWGWTRKAIAALLGEGFAVDKAGLRYEDRKPAWAILT